MHVQQLGPYIFEQPSDRAAFGIKQPSGSSSLRDCVLFRNPAVYVIGDAQLFASQDAKERMLVSSK
jgi:hypothetical protein